MADFNYFQAIMYLILYILIICFIGIIIYGVKKYKSEKRIGGIFVTIIVSLLLLYGINQLAIFNLFFSNKTSFAQGDYKKAAFYTGIAAKDPDTLYRTTDTNKVYLGTIQLGGA